MARKTRRMKERATIRRSRAAEEVVLSSVPASESRSTLSPSVRPTFATPTFDYTHIYSDLRRIAFFAIFFFAILIALSFLIK